MEEFEKKLSQLQLSVYNYVSKNQRVEYSKEKLIKALNLKSKTALTRGVNTLLKQSLVMEVKEGDVTYLKVVSSPDKANRFDDNDFDEVVGKKVDLTKVEKTTATSSFEKNEKIEAMKGEKVEQEQSADRIAEPLKKTEEKVDASVEIKKSGSLLKDNPKEFVLMVNEKEVTLANKEQDQERELDLNRSRSVIKNFNNIGISRDSILDATNTEGKINDIAYKIAKNDKTLSENQIILMVHIYRYFLENDEWMNNLNAEIMSLTGLTKSALTSCKKRLLEQGYLCLTSGEDLSEVKKLAITHLGAKKITLVIKNVLKKLPIKKQKTVELVEIPDKEQYGNRVYLIDTENVGLLIDESILSQLTSDDTVLLCLSDKSGRERISSEQLHWILEAECKVKSLLVKTCGRGRNDLDHVLVAELVVLLTEKPNSQFIILSHDQGYLAAVSHLIKRLKLKNSQILLKKKF